MAAAKLFVLSCCASASILTSAAVINTRNTAQGWSLQSGSCPSGSTSCGGGACCPAGLSCMPPSQDEVASCCPSSNSCVGAIEGAPRCADSAWSLWEGLNGNDFCCEAEMTGYYYDSGSVAGACATSVPAEAKKATLMTSGIVTSVQTATSTPSAPASSTASVPASSTSGVPSGNGSKAVFAHYMIGSMTSEEAVKDVQDAIAVGFDGFALNTHDVTDSYATDAIQYLFDAAENTNFKLFFSFDTSWGSGGASLNTFSSFISQYAGHPAHYTVSGRPFISTFNGGTISNGDWQSQFIQPLVNAGHTPFFVPDFDDMSGFPSNVFETFPVMDGAYSWEDAWPAPGSTISSVSDSVASSLIQQAKQNGKVTMMPVSTFQFKYMGSGQDWYRIGESTLPQRLAQVLDLQPDFVEVITWNDGGESHFIGTVWPEQIACCSSIQAYADGFDHTGWQQVIAPFIKAYKAGAADISSITPLSNTPQGALWYRPLLTTASCSNSIANYQEAQDALNLAVLLPADASNYSIKVYSNGNLLKTIPGQPGLNGATVLGLQAGPASTQKLEILDGNGSVISTATGTKDVLAQSPNATCNWNYEVVGLSS